MRGPISPEVRAALLAAQWAQQIGLPAGNLWEPAIARNVVKDWTALGADDNAWAFIKSLYSLRLGLPGVVRHGEEPL